MRKPKPCVQCDGEATVRQKRGNGPSFGSERAKFAAHFSRTMRLPPSNQISGINRKGQV